MRLPRAAQEQTFDESRKIRMGNEIKPRIRATFIIARHACIRDAV